MTMKINYCHNIDALSGLRQMETGSVNCCVTSPPYYGLRDYGADGQIGLEPTPEEFIERLIQVFHEFFRVLQDDGTLWINMGDSYAGSGKGAWANIEAQKEVYVLDTDSAPALMPKTFDGIKPKDLMGIPWMLAFALRADGWYLRDDIIWEKPNPMPESVSDRCTKAHEYIFLLSKQKHYYFDGQAIREPCAGTNMLPPAGSEGTVLPNSRKRLKGNNKTFRGSGVYTQNQSFHNSTTVQKQSRGNATNETLMRNKRDVWCVSSSTAFHSTHFATFPSELIKPCILAGCPEGGLVCDPFMGSGTTLVEANRLNRNCIGFDVNPLYCRLANQRREEAMAQTSLFRNIQ